MFSTTCLVRRMSESAVVKLEPSDAGGRIMTAGAFNRLVVFFQSPTSFPTSTPKCWEILESSLFVRQQKCVFLKMFPQVFLSRG